MTSDATLGPDEQYVAATVKDLLRDATLRHERYWALPDSPRLADPNPFALLSGCVANAARDCPGILIRRPALQTMPSCCR